MASATEACNESRLKAKLEAKGARGSCDIQGPRRALHGVRSWVVSSVRSDPSIAVTVRCVHGVHQGQLRSVSGAC
eukprot:373461-Amphidinium_carterae.1